MSQTNKTYLTLLNDILGKKETILNQLILETIKQAGCFSGEEFEEEKYNESYEKKTDMIKQIEELDEGFDSLFERIKEDITRNKYEYETEIKQLQDYIRSITEKGLRLQKLESENKQKFDMMLSRQRKKLKEYNISKKTAANYYQNMMRQFSKNSIEYKKQN